jgi:hypothetical protein
MKIIVPQSLFIVNLKYKNLCDIPFAYSQMLSSGGKDFVMHKNTFLDKINSFNKKKIISVYCKTDYIHSLLNIIKNMSLKFILFTGCSDTTIDYNLFLNRPKNVIKWFGENPSFQDKDFIPTPIGSLGGSWIGNEEIIPELKSHKNFVQTHVDNKEKNIKNMILLSFSLHTNYNHRKEMYKYFKDKKYVTNLVSTNNVKKLTESEFCNMIYNHEFILSPEGNGIDCGRTWMALQLGSIPIVKSSPFTEYFRNKLPIFIYKKLEEITTENLINFKKNANYNYDLININYYKNLIQKITES